MSKISRILVIGSGPVVIGQAVVEGKLADVGQPARHMQPTQQAQPTERIEPKRWILSENDWKLGVEG